MAERTLGRLLLDSRRALESGLGLDANVAGIEVRALAAAALGSPICGLLPLEPKPPPAGFRLRMQESIRRRLKSEPVAYIVRSKEFYGIGFAVSDAVLVPRPETELVVDKILEATSEDSALAIADLGTGCGAIAAAVATHRPMCRVIATDKDMRALLQAKENFSALRLDNVEARKADWLEAFGDDEKLDVIASNPPYLTSAEAAGRSGDLAHEPLDAFDGGADGFDAIRMIAKGSAGLLNPDGLLLVEHGFDQGERMRNIMEDTGFSCIETFPDLAGLPRLTTCRKPSGGRQKLRA